MPRPHHAGGILTVDLNKIAENYGRLKSLLNGVTCGAVVKADAYGLGLSEVSQRLFREGCRDFFVALTDEGLSLRQDLRENGSSARIYVLNGVERGAEDLFVERDLIPVLNQLDEIKRWGVAGDRHSKPLPAIVNFDTGMARLGLDTLETDKLLADQSHLSAIDVRYIMSHLACSDESDNELNNQQNNKLKDISDKLDKDYSVSLSNSGGVFLGPEYHYQLARPGAALYGIKSSDLQTNQIAQVVRLQGKILQTRFVDTNMTVGYGATHSVIRNSRLATVALGYGDGLFRALSNRGSGYIGEHRAPIVGRVSMDLVTLDVTDIPEQETAPGVMVDFLTQHHTVDDLARDAGTIGYEVLTALGNRYHRRYIGGISA